MSQVSVNYDQIGTFDFTITAPQQVGTYYQGFNLVIDGVTWFNNVGPSLQINVANPLPEPPVTTENILAPGETLADKQNIYSPERNSVLRIEYGQLILYSNFNRAWVAPNMGAGAHRLVNQTDGNLVMYSATGDPLWSSNTSGKGPSYLKLQTDGNLVLYSESGPTWSSNTAIGSQLIQINNTISDQQTIFPGQFLTTADRSLRLEFQTDGNLVLYSPYRALWSSRTVGSGATKMVLQADGNLVLYRKDDRAVWATNTSGRGYSSLLLQPDSNLVLYSNSGAGWSTGTAGRL